MERFNNIIEILKYQSENFGSRLFIYNKNNRYTYRQFYESIIIDSKKFEYLKEYDSPNIGLCFSDNIKFINRLFVIWNSNLIPVIINPKLTSSEIQNLLAQTDCLDILTDTTYKQDNKQVLEIKNGTKGENLGNDTACILFTSGTTSKAKGVVLSHNSLINSATIFKEYFQVSENDNFISSLPLYHIGGLMIIIRALLSGSSVYIPEMLKGELFSQEIIYSKPQFISVVPTQLRYLLDYGINKDVKAIILGGAASSTSLILEALEKGFPIYKVYGSSETSSMVSICSPVEITKFPESSGRAFEGIDIYTIDERGEKNPNNTIGEIVIKSNTLFDCYYNQLDITNDKLSDGEYKTGDIGIINSEGFLFVYNRREDLIIRGGENISPYEIETELKKIPQIKDACVIGVNNDKLGQVPVAFVIKSEHITETEINNYLKLTLAEFKIPRIIIPIEQFPLNEMGKIDRNELRQFLQTD